jgi:hypothetical protein
MTIHAGMTEIEFIEEIDCCFFFDTEEEYETATRIACSISDNAALMVGYELATLSSHASTEVGLRLLQIMKSERPTPVILAAAPVVATLIKKEKVRQEDVQRLLEVCRQHNNAWNGLGIVECADNALASECDQIRDSWSKADS